MRRGRGEKGTIERGGYYGGVGWMGGLSNWWRVMG